MSTLSRRRFLQAAMLTLAGGAGLSIAQAPQAHALGAVRGTIIDFSAGVPSAQAIKNAGHIGAIRYVSQRRPGAEWMKGKPVTLAETQAMASVGMATASIYQFGRAETADWKQGAAGAAIHAPQAIALHIAAGGPTNRPIYVAIDDNPTHTEYTSLIRPYLQAFQTALKASGYQMGVYANYATIDWAAADGLGEFFWQHDWGSQGRINNRINIHQVAGKRGVIDGIEVDINHVYTADWGQWTPGQAAPHIPNIPSGNIAIPDLNQLSSQLPIPPELKNLPMPTQDQMNQALKIIQSSS
ncbi:DUF1906 domain-containing protein [Corynebacterium kutscheri]|uniref:Secreted protein n=1 Tax=Corynebacterium kutscheri TaxID=35755 RepID=A0AB38VNW4_9CORY|nr:DUF1906 domain-containing protein [Corynebacterium kutscheri]VEH04403.1 putative secreted protein [Corynebacterium kutscheri]